MDLRKLSIVLLVVAAGIMGFTFLAEKDKTKSEEVQRQQVALATQQKNAEPTAPPAPTPPVEKSVEPLPAAPTNAVKIFTNHAKLEKFTSIGSLDPRDGYAFQVELSNRGGAINTVKLADYFVKVADHRRYLADPNTYSQALLENPKKYGGHYSVLNPVGTEGASRYLPIETGTISIQIAGEDQPLQGNLRQLYWLPAKKTPSAPLRSSQSASFTVTIFSGKTAAKAQRNPIVRCVKTYTVTKGDYSIAMSLRVENLCGKRIQVTLDQSGPTGLPREDLRADLRQAAYAYLQTVDKKVQNRLKPNKELNDWPFGKHHKLGSSDGKDPILWVGHINKFFGSMMYLIPKVKGRLEAPAHRADFYVAAARESANSRTYLTGVRLRKMELKPRQDKELAFDIFAGPKKRDLFENPDARYTKDLYRDLRYIGTIDFRSCFCALDWLSLALLWLLDRFSWLAFGNYGVAIIILVLLVRLVLHPLTKRSQVSMMGMQKLGPKIAKLKEKYADDKNTLNKEMMKVYKKHGASPMLGCLPMFLQMPIWFALFGGLNASIELRHAAFLPIWITDLAAPDALFTWSTPIMLIGTSFNLLPILLGIAMFFQQKYSPQSAKAATPEQAQQQKMMKFMFPLMMPVFFYSAPSGLNLYIMASTFAGVLDQYYVRKHIREKEAAQAAEQMTVRIPGKAARIARPKKPKGPFWTKRG